MVLASCAIPVGAHGGENAPVASAEQLPADDSQVAQPPIVGFTTWRFTWDNDVVLNSDNEFSNGISLQVHGPPARSLADAAGTPAFGKAMARWFLPDSRHDLLFREGWSIVQSIQTPDDQETAELVVNDVPYAAALAVQNTWIAYDDRRLYGFGWLFGMVGPAALGEPVQKGFHKLTGNSEPMGWDNQVKNEPLINFYYEHARKLVRSSFGDLAVHMDARLGNLVTAAEVRLEGRLGWHVPGGFMYVPDPIGRHLSYDSHLPPRKPANWAFYGSVSAGETIVGYTAFFDGNLFRDSHSIDYNHSIQSLEFGLHYQRWRWGLHLNLAFSSDVADPSIASDTKDNYGSLMFEFRH